MNEALESQLIVLEKRLLEPQVRASREELDDLLADDFLEFGASGVRFGKAQALDRLPTETAPSFFTQDFELRGLGQDVAQLVYRAIIERPGQPRLYSLRSSIWRRQAEQWAMVFHQGTACEPFEPAIVEGSQSCP